VNGLREIQLFTNDNNVIVTRVSSTIRVVRFGYAVCVKVSKLLFDETIDAVLFVFHTYEYQNYRIFQMFLREGFMYNILLHNDITLYNRVCDTIIDNV